MKRIGPNYGYYPKPSKTIIIVKRPEDFEEVNRIFAGEGITITLEGERHLGAALGSEEFKARRGGGGARIFLDQFFRLGLSETSFRCEFNTNPPRKKIIIQKSYDLINLSILLKP